MLQIWSTENSVIAVRFFLNIFYLSKNSGEKIFFHSSTAHSKLYKNGSIRIPFGEILSQKIRVYRRSYTKRILICHRVSVNTVESRIRCFPFVNITSLRLYTREILLFIQTLEADSLE
jgi:hypothetical protein